MFLLWFFYFNTPPTQMMMIVNISDEQSTLPFSAEAIEAIAAAVISHEGCSTDEVSFIFVDTPTICGLHDEFFDDPSTTDCISFPVDGRREQNDESDEHHVLGEVFICPETAINYCQKEGGDPYDELRLYMIHGLLHLMGYDDIETADREKMRDAEKKHMEHTAANNLLIR